MRRVNMQDFEQLNSKIKLLSDRIDKIESMNSRLMLLENNTVLTPRLITGSEAASYLGISPSFLQRLIKDKSIPFTRIRRKILFDKIELDEWITSNNHAI